MKTYVKFMAVFTFCFCFLIVAPAWAASTTVSTALGDVVGVENDGISSFKGIPYGKAPVGELRFAPPQSAEPWQEPLNCENYGPTAVQIKAREGLAMSEDCLSLNIWTPAKPGDNAKLPVYVFIHGGAYAVGSGADAKYDGTSFAKHGIVAVTINYRVNALGFFASQTTYNQYGTTGNWGHLDQIKALEWIRDNIAAFGGDPDNVTIGGESAGSYSVSALILSPLAQGLFHGAILESGTILGASANTYYAKCDLQRSIEVCGMLAKMFGADDNVAGLAKLREADAHVLAQASEFQADLTKLLAFFLMPAYDGTVLPLDPYKALREGAFNKVRLLWGFNSDEGSMFVPADTNEHEYALMTTMVYGGKAQTVLNRFPVTAETPALERARQLKAYSIFTVGMKIYGDALAKSGLNVYAYNFNHAIPQTEAADLGAMHALELPFVFNNLKTWKIDSAENTALAEEMHLRWINFIKNGDPNKGEELPTSIAWPKYDADKPQVLRFGNKLSVEILPDRENLEFLEEVTFN